MRKSKLFAGLLVTALAFCLVGCGEKKDTKKNDETSAKVVENVTDAPTSAEPTTDAPTEEETTATPSGRPENPEKGEVTDTCLVVGDRIIDFETYRGTEALGINFEKRSDSMIAITVDKGKDSEISVGYSSTHSTVGEEIAHAEKVFPNGSETIEDAQWGDVIYGIEKEDNGTRVVVYQDIGGKYYVSIRIFSKLKTVDPLLLVDSYMIKDLPIYAK